MVVGTAEQVEGAVFRLRGVFEDGEEKLGLGFDVRVTKGECEDRGLLGFVFRRSFLEFEQAFFGIVDTEAEDFIGIIGGMPRVFPVGGFQFHGCGAKIVCHIGLRAGGEQERESQADNEMQGFHGHLWGRGFSQEEYKPALTYLKRHL